MLRLLVTLALVAIPVTRAFAWGDEGHRIVCEIAFREVADGTRDAIKALITSDGSFTRFSDSCAWPDHPRQRAEEHYVDLVRYSAGMTDDNCPLADTCVVSASTSSVSNT